MFLSLLFAPAMWLTDPQNADALPEPVAVTAANTRYTPSRAVRSATVVPGLPATPVTVRFQCMVDAHFGEPTACIPLDAGAAPVRSRAEFERLATAQLPNDDPIWSQAQGGREQLSDVQCASAPFVSRASLQRNDVWVRKLEFARVLDGHDAQICGNERRNAAQ